MNIIPTIAGIFLGIYLGSIYPTSIPHEIATRLPYNEMGKSTPGALDSTKIELIWDMSQLK